MSFFQVPVVMGPPKQSYERMAPPNSYIHIQDFPTAKDLAKYEFICGRIQKLQYRAWHIHVFRYLLYLDSHPEEYLKYLGKWISIEFSYWLIALQRGKGDIKRNVLNLGVVICAERCRRCRDQEDERSRASSICGRTVLATQTGLIRRGVSNDGTAVPSHIGATLSLG